MLPSIKSNSTLIYILFILFSLDLLVYFDVPFLRQLVGFSIITFLPGLLILQILKLNKLGLTDKFVLAMGLSISFLILFGLLVNNVLIGFGYEKPLTVFPLLILLNIAFIILSIVGYKTNNDHICSNIRVNLSKFEKTMLIVPSFFPILSIFGTEYMNTYSNNIFIITLLIAISCYTIVICYYNTKFTESFYPPVILLISISILLLMGLRSNHIIGVDTHREYYYFLTTFKNSYWSILENSTLDSALSISLLPTVYQVILNTNPEYLFKILFPLLFSSSPLIIYLISKKYVGELYGFLSACSFMFLHNFLWTTFHARTNTAILFFALAMMVLFHPKITFINKKLLFIVFMTSCILSHYSTTYLFFIVLSLVVVISELLSLKYTFEKTINLKTAILFFTIIVLWYSLITKGAFFSGVKFIENTIFSLNDFFIEESRSDSVNAMLGKNLELIPQKIEFIFTWLYFLVTGAGVITLIRKYKQMSFPEIKFEKRNYLKNKFETEYFLIAIMFMILFVVAVLSPYVTVGYSLDRIHLLGMIILSVLFIVGGIELSIFLKIPAYIPILFVLIPYFFCTTGVMYYAFDVPREIILDSEGTLYDNLYVHDQESYGAMWLKEYGEKISIYGDHYTKMRLISQSGIDSLIYAKSLIEDNEFVEEGYIYLRYTGVVNKKLLDNNFQWHKFNEYKHLFFEKNKKIYSNGGTEVYMI